MSEARESLSRLIPNTSAGCLSIEQNAQRRLFCLHIRFSSKEVYQVKYEKRQLIIWATAALIAVFAFAIAMIGGAII